MRKIHLLTILALLLIPFALYQSFINYPIVASATAFVAFMFVFIDNQNITGRFQHLSMLITGLALAYIMEFNLSGFPYAGIAVMVLVAGFIVRMVFIKKLSYSQYRYFELSMLLLAFGLTLLKVIQIQKDWIFLFPVYVMLILLLMHTYIIVKNAFMLSTGIKNGYNAKPGTKAPDFLLPDQFGNAVSLSDFRSKRHVLLIFVRGDWCPYCHMIMRTYMRESHKFKEKNIMLIAIGPDPVGINREMAQKLGLDYLILSDDKMLVAELYGIRLPDFQLPSATKHTEGMPLPASFLIDKEGIVRYASRTEKIGEFLDPKRIFPIVKNLN